MVNAKKGPLYVANAHVLSLKISWNEAISFSDICLQYLYLFEGIYALFDDFKLTKTGSTEYVTLPDIQRIIFFYIFIKYLTKYACMHFTYM